MASELYADFYVSANQYEVGPSSGTASSNQIHNATKIYRYFHEYLGWTLNATAGMLGNMMYESCLDPACVYPKSRFPNGGASLADLDNSYAINITNSAYGLVQWYGTTQTAPAGNQIVSYAMRYNTQWYDGGIQMQRLWWEWSEEQKWHSQIVDSVKWTFQGYSSSTETPEQLAKVFMMCYEGTYSVLSTRQANARYWYDYFDDTPLPPDPDPPTPPEPPEPIDPSWIMGETFAQIALSYKNQYIPYEQMDCIAFVQTCWKRIPAAQNSGNLPNGTNSLWRSILRYPVTASPFGEQPCPLLWYKDTLFNCRRRFKGIPVGCLLFHQIGEEGPPPIPEQYAGDGIGNFVHVGIYCGNNRVMQSGGKDAASVHGGGVHESQFDESAWNYVAFLIWIDPGVYDPEPPPYIPYWLYFKFKNERKGRILK